MFLSDEDPRLLPVALRSELIAAGESDRSLARALRTGRFERARRGAYVDGHSWRAASDEERYAVRARAAYRAAKSEVALSHTSALPFLDAPLWGLGLDDIHLTRLDGRCGRREAGIRQHRGVVLDGDVVEAHGLRMSSPLRATLEVATLGSIEAGLVVANHFLHRGDFTKEDLQGRYGGSLEHWPGSLKTDVVLRLAHPKIESIGESRTYHFLWTHHFPRPEPQYAVFDNGVLVALLDFALPEQKVWIEFDGKVKYQRHLRAGEDVTAFVLREKRREERIAEITGWRCLRITWADLLYPERLAARLQRLIESMVRFS